MIENDWEHQHAICLAAQQSQYWMPAIDSRRHEVIQIQFSKRECQAWAVQSQCTYSNPPRRSITVQPEARYLSAAWERKPRPPLPIRVRGAPVLKARSHLARVFNLRRSRYVGKVKTHLQHLLIAMAIHLPESPTRPEAAHPARLPRLPVPASHPVVGEHSQRGRSRSCPRALRARKTLFARLVIFPAAPASRRRPRWTIRDLCVPAAAAATTIVLLLQA